LINHAKNRFEAQQEVGSSHNSLTIEVKPIIQTFKFNSRPIETVNVLKETPGPGGYFMDKIPTSLDGPKYSFAKLKRNFGSFFGEDTKVESRKNSVNPPIINLDKYKTESFIDISHLNERKFLK